MAAVNAACACVQQMDLYNQNTDGIFKASGGEDSQEESWTSYTLRRHVDNSRRMLTLEFLLNAKRGFMLKAIRYVWMLCV